MALELMNLVDSLFQFIDKDGNGEISWLEFVSFQHKSKKVFTSDWTLDIQTMRNEFIEMDTDSNGSISKAEFLKAFKNLHKKRPRGVETICRMIRKVIHTNDVMEVTRRKELVTTMLKIFDDADIDSNGSIDFAEFLKHEWEGRPELNYRNSNLRLIRRQFRKIDTNRDGKISRAEFVAMIEKCLDEEY